MNQLDRERESASIRAAALERRLTGHLTAALYSFQTAAIDLAINTHSVKSTGRRGDRLPHRIYSLSPSHSIFV